MGTGRSGIPKGVRNTGKRTELSEFRVNARNLKDYNIKMEYRLKQNVPEEAINRALETLNHLAGILGMNPNDLPQISLGFSTQFGSYGDCVMEYDVNSTQDARIRLNAGMFEDKNYDTMAHEYVHALEGWMIRNNFNDQWDRINAWISDLYSEAMCRNALFKMGKNPGATLDRDVWKAEAATIKLNKYDDYAQSKPGETLTRAVQTVLRFGDNASPFAKALVQELKLEVTSLQKKRKKK